MVWLIWAIYAGLLIFAINGLQLMALRSRAYELKVQEERIRRLLMRVRLRNGRL